MSFPAAPPRPRQRRTVANRALMSAQEAALELKRNVRAVYRLFASGRIAGFKASSRTLTLERASVRAYAREHPIAISANPGDAPATSPLNLTPTRLWLTPPNCNT